MAKRGWTGRNHTQAFDTLIEKALVEIGGLIEGDAALEAPRKTGRLAGSITYATKQTQSAVEAPATRKDQIGKPSKRNEVWIGTNVEYAEAMEYGADPFELNRAVNIKGVGWRFIKHHPGMPDQRYLRPALDRNRKNAIKILRDALRQEYGKG